MLSGPRPGINGLDETLKEIGETRSMHRSSVTRQTYLNRAKRKGGRGRHWPVHPMARNRGRRALRLAHAGQRGQTQRGGHKASPLSRSLVRGVCGPGLPTRGLGERGRAPRGTAKNRAQVAGDWCLELSRPVQAYQRTGGVELEAMTAAIRAVAHAASAKVSTSLLQIVGVGGRALLRLYPSLSTAI